MHQQRQLDQWDQMHPPRRQARSGPWARSPHSFRSNQQDQSGPSDQKGHRLDPLARSDLRNLPGPSVRSDPSIRWILLALWPPSVQSPRSDRLDRQTDL